ncbi:hypothetical protein FRC20_005728 [Serendipita sp. 405]|nr:hypothetical protein FRC20_005728 [Serendipita sp. 405]
MGQRALNPNGDTSMVLSHDVFTQMNIFWSTPTVRYRLNMILTVRRYDFDPLVTLIKVAYAICRRAEQAFPLTLNYKKKIWATLVPSTEENPPSMRTHLLSQLHSHYSSLQKRAIFIYVSPSGSDSNSGTSTSAPLKTIQAAVNKAVAGDTIFLRAGTYAPSTNIQITKSGTSSAPITLKNYNGEKVIIDGENMPYTPAALGADLPNADRGAIHIQNANYWIFEGLEVIHGAYGVYSRDASYNIYRNLITRDNYESGLQIQGTAAYNQVINLDSYGNRDPRKNGESADGLAIKEGSGAGNVVRGARLWNNADDGFDGNVFKVSVYTNSQSLTSHRTIWLLRISPAFEVRIDSAHIAKAITDPLCSLFRRF